jgi:MFS family permease
MVEGIKTFLPAEFRFANKVATDTGRSPTKTDQRLEVHPRKSFGLDLIFSAMLGKYRRRSVLALTLMVAQSFLYNSVFFTFGLILAHFYHVPDQHIGFYILPLAIGNFCGPLLLGALFDTVGRRKMISLTFGLSGVLLIVTALLFGLDRLTALTQTIAWLAIFFVASPAASSAYLTASEIFPLETRALAIACFYALGTAIGGSIAPSVFGRLIETGSSWQVSLGYVLAALLLLAASAVELKFGVDAEGNSLESIADPLSH